MQTTKLARRTLLGTGGMATALWQAGMPVVTQSYARGVGSGLPSAAELYAMAAAKQAINNAFLPSGSDAHTTWVSQLATALTAAGVQDVTTPPFTFTQWSPIDFSLTIQNGSRRGDIDVDVAGYVPYSGSTPPGGITAPLTYLGGVTGFFGPPPAGEQATTISANFMGFPLNVSVNGQTLAQSITNLGVQGKIVMLDLPTPALPLQDVLQGAFFVNDAKTIPDELGVGGLTGLFFTSAFAAALLSAGALGVVFVVPFRRFWANNYYFRGTIAGIPILLVDAEEGTRLKDIVSGENGASATLTLAAEVNASATLHSLLGVIPGQSEKLIILNSHSDSANIIEEIGPIVIWGLARYLAGLPLSARPYTIQIMIEGSHLVGDLDERAYITANSANLMQNALVDVTIEHVGGRELMQSPAGGQVPRPDGLLETNWLSVGPIPGTTTTFSDPVVRGAIALAKKLGRSFVAPTSLVGLGISGPWRAVTTTTASIDQPAWLLNINMPDHLELNKLLDFQALQTAVEGYAEMLTTFMNTPVADFGKAYIA